MGHKSSCKHEGRGTWEWNYPRRRKWSSMTKRNQSWRHPLELRDPVKDKTRIAWGFQLHTIANAFCLSFLLGFLSFILLSNLAIAARTEAPLLQTCLTHTDKMMVTTAATSLWVINSTHTTETQKNSLLFPPHRRNTELLDMSGASNLIAHYLIWTGTISVLNQSPSSVPTHNCYPSSF